MKKLALILVAAIGCLPPLSFAQARDLPVDDRGLKPFGSYAGRNLDSINMANGSLTLHIPFWSYPQRGDKLRLNYFINFTSNPWKTTEFCGPNACHERWQWLCHEIPTDAVWVLVRIASASPAQSTGLPATLDH